jgi:hypothetical protein
MDTVNSEITFNKHPPRYVLASGGGGGWIARNFNCAIIAGNRNNSSMDIIERILTIYPHLAWIVERKNRTTATMNFSLL